MIKKLLLASLLLGAANMYADTMNISYSEGKHTDGSSRGVGFGDNKEIETAFKLPASTVKLLTGNKITGINGCLSSAADIETVYIFVRSELAGDNLAFFKLVPNQLNQVKRGANKLKFKEPYTIPADITGDLYIGFGYIMSDVNAHGLSSNSIPIPGAFYLRGGNGKWEDYSNYGCASIEAVIEGEALPSYNLRLSRVDAPEAISLSRGRYTAEFYIHNFGAKAVTAFDIVAKIEGNEVDRQRVERTVEPNQMAICAVTFSPKMSERGDKDIAYTIENVAEGADADPIDNTLSAVSELVPIDFQRNVLSEEFTTEWCGSCPPVVEMLHELLQKPEFANVIQVAHHAGYKTDFLTTPFHSKYVELYGGGSFAPGLCIDRTPLSVTEQVFFPDDDKVIKEWNKRLNTPALVTVNINAAYTDTQENKVRVTVSGEKSTLHLAENPVVTVWLVEDEIASQDQAAAGPDFIHNHVTRACGSQDYWGDAVTFEADKYSYTCDIEIDPSWKKENMHIVAFLGENTGKWKGHTVKNAARIGFSAIADSGVESIDSSKEISSIEYYDFTGRRVSNPETGIVLKRVFYCDGSVKTIKTVVK